MIQYIIAIGIYLLPSVSQACATCYGASDAPATEGMNWAIITLLGVTGGMLGGIGAIMVRLKNRAKYLSSNQKEI